ncbi:MAG: hypothetical protein KBC84_05405 [Proteobacteria bacterium]|nr:hypothetical protein [Pseudomonadota bacterium]
MSDIKSVASVNTAAEKQLKQISELKDLLIPIESSREVRLPEASLQLSKFQQSLKDDLSISGYLTNTLKAVYNLYSDTADTNYKISASIELRQQQLQTFESEYQVLDDKLKVFALDAVCKLAKGEQIEEKAIHELRKELEDFVEKGTSIVSSLDESINKRLELYNESQKAYAEALLNIVTSATTSSLLIGAKCNPMVAILANAAARTIFLAIDESNKGGFNDKTVLEIMTILSTEGVAKGLAYGAGDVFSFRIGNVIRGLPYSTQALASVQGLSGLTASEGKRLFLSHLASYYVEGAINSSVSTFADKALKGKTSYSDIGDSLVAGLVGGAFNSVINSSLFRLQFRGLDEFQKYSHITDVVLGLDKKRVKPEVAEKILQTTSRIYIEKAARISDTIDYVYDVIPRKESSGLLSAIIGFARENGQIKALDDFALAIAHRIERTGSRGQPNNKHHLMCSLSVLIGDMLHPGSDPLRFNNLFSTLSRTNNYGLSFIKNWPNLGNHLRHIKEIIDSPSNAGDLAEGIDISVIGDAVKVLKSPYAALLEVGSSASAIKLQQTPEPGDFSRWVGLTSRADIDLILEKLRDYHQDIGKLELFESVNAFFHGLHPETKEARVIPALFELERIYGGNCTPFVDMSIVVKGRSRDEELSLLYEYFIYRGARLYSMFNDMYNVN